MLCVGHHFASHQSLPFSCKLLGGLTQLQESYVGAQAKLLVFLCGNVVKDSRAIPRGRERQKEQMHGLAQHGIETFGRIDSNFWEMASFCRPRLPARPAVRLLWRLRAMNPMPASPDIQPDRISSQTGYPPRPDIQPDPISSQQDWLSGQSSTSYLAKYATWV